MKGSYEEYKEKRKLLEEVYNKGIEESRLKDAVDSVNAYLKNHEGSDVYFTLECAKARCLIPNKDLVGNHAYEIRRKHVPYILAQKMTEFIVDNNWLDISEINCYDPNYTQFEAEMIVLVRHKPKETKSKFDKEKTKMKMNKSIIKYKKAVKRYNNIAERLNTIRKDYTPLPLMDGVDTDEAPDTISNRIVLRLNTFMYNALFTYCVSIEKLSRTIDYRLATLLLGIPMMVVIGVVWLILKSMFLFDKVAL